VIYLETTAAQQAKRVRLSRNRPLLSNVNVLAKLAQLTRERAPLYAEIADITVTTDGRGIGSVVDEIARILPHAREHSDSRTRQP
jgi:shikimate kinase